VTLANDLRDVFGWSRPFAGELLPTAMLDALHDADLIDKDGGQLRSRVRFASVGERLFAHSAFPTATSDAVFFGPDSYRFCALIERWAHRARRLVDVGCGSGVGGIVAAPHAQEVVLADVNAQALWFAQVNAALNATDVSVVSSDVLAAIDGPVDLVIANPPYMRDPAGRMYRDGGGSHGEALAVRIAREALARLEPDGALILYTGSAIVDGRDVFLEAVTPVLRAAGRPFHYEELDPDVFGEELDQASYANVERIAVVGLHVARDLLVAQPQRPNAAR
ncbi:MAG TPA: class I SAM-dependent methyltransferase, partial [Polyangiales bacterium]|nr:class I SAM-dependent methyltransferase [Polyangiales bacterium]